MPLPKSGDVGAVYSFLKKDKPNMPHKQKIAIALNQSRQHGGNAVSRRLKKLKKGQNARSKNRW